MKLSFLKKKKKRNFKLFFRKLKFFFSLSVHPLFTSYKPAPPDPPLLRHAEDPTSVKPVLPDTTVLCARCHTASIAKPKGFPQVVPADHSNGMPCDTCHQPHSPGMDAQVTDAQIKGAGGGK